MEQLEILDRIAARLASRGLRVPSRLDAALTALRSAPESEHARIAGALHRLVPAVQHVIRPYPGALCPSYPRTSAEYQARLVLGERPAQILRGLTAREAHEALASGHQGTAAGWLCRDLGACARSVPVARWLLACRRDPARWEALSRERVERGPDGTEIHGRYLDRVDEIVAADLPAAERSSVRAVFAAAARRIYAAWCARAEDDHAQLAPAPAWWRPIRCARPLLSAAALVAEGRAMQHCVGTYARVVAHRRSLILSIAVPTRTGVERSTAELDYRTGAVRQHRGPQNRTPHPLCVAALEVALARCATTKERRAA